jgi:hypothetical protein
MITNNENLYAVYSSDGILSGFQENAANKITTSSSSQTIGGGESNTIYQGSYSTINGGYSNNISGSSYASILAGQRGLVKSADGATLLADGQNRIHYGEVSNSLALDYADGIYIKDGNDLNAVSNKSTNSGTFVKIETGPDFKIGSYIGGLKEENYTWQTNYYPLAKTKMTLMTNNWITGNEYVIRLGQDRRYYTDRIDSISSISLGYDGIHLRGVNANQQVEGNPAVGYININGDVTIESAKDGNAINLNSDSEINLNGAVYARSYHSRGIIDYDITFNTPSNFYTDAGNGINLRSSGANGINLNSVGTSDVITIKSGISLSSSDYNLNLIGEKVNITSHDSSVNLYAENGMSLKTDSESINIHAGGGDSYSDLDLRANRYVTLSGENVKVNPNLIYGFANRVDFIANDTSINLQAENGVNISSESEPINISTVSSTNLRNNIYLRAAGDVSLSGNNGVYVYGALYLNGRQLLVSAAGTVFSPTIIAG